MTPPILLYVLSRPRAIPISAWEQFYHDDHLDDLIKHEVARSGTMYASVPDLMSCGPPDNHTHLVLFETEHARPLQSPVFKHVGNTSPLFPSGASTPDISDLECLHYESLEVFDPKGFGRVGAAPRLLQMEIAVDNTDTLRIFYRREHIPMTAKHPGYRRAIMYRCLETSVIHGVTAATPAPESLIILHEFNDFEELGGPITQAALQTDNAAKM